MAPVLQDDPDGKEVVADEAVKLVVPSLQRFIQRNLDKEFSKSACTFSVVSDHDAHEPIIRCRSSEVYVSRL